MNVSGWHGNLWFPRLLLLVSVLSFCWAVMYGQEGEGPGEAYDSPGARSAYEWMRLHDPATGGIPRGIREREIRFATTLPTKEALANSKTYRERAVASVQSLTWSARGPVNVGGRTRALALDIADESIILAGGVSGGMWRSTDGGSSWSKVTAVSDLQSVTCIAQDTRPGHTNVWYYGTGEAIGGSASAGFGAVYGGDGVFKSTDNGVSWAQLPSTVSGTPTTFTAFDFIYTIAVDSSNALQDILYAAVYGAIMRSSDGGATWAAVLGSGDFAYRNSFATDVAVSSTGIIYATLSEATLWSMLGVDSSSDSRGIFRSTNGTTWTNITPAGWPGRYDRIVLGIARSNENAVYFLAETPGTGFHTVYAGLHNWTSLWKYLYFSGDGSGGGGGWLDRTGNIPTGGTGGDFANQLSYDLVVRPRPDNENMVFIGGVNLYRSTDGFATTANTSWIGGWSTSGLGAYPGHHADQHAVVFSRSSPSTMFTGSDGGIHVTSDDLASTVAWLPLNTGYGTSQFYSVAVDHATLGNSVLIGGMQDNGTAFTNSPSSSLPWSTIQRGDGSFCSIADGRSSYYVSAQNSVLYRRVLANDGSLISWTRIDPVGGTGYLFINPFALDPNDMTMMYLAGGLTLWRNSDLTGIPLASNSKTLVNWTHLLSSAINSGAISAIGVSKIPAHRVYYGTTEGSVYRLNGANVGDPVPVNVTGAGFPAGAFVSCLAVDPIDGDRVVAVFSNYGVVSLFSTTDGGTSWTDVSGNLEEHVDGSGNGPSCRWISILPGSGYFIGTSTGLYSTAVLNGSSTVWVQEGSGSIGNMVVDMTDARLSDGLIVAATHGNGIYSAAGNAVHVSTVHGGWNMVSVPVSVSDPHTSTLYPGVAAAYGYQGAYLEADTLVNGQGYWLKFSSSLTIPILGSVRMLDTIEVATGWNLTGSVSAPVAVAGIGSIPPGIVTSPFYTYNGSYVTSDTVEPGKAYWVKANEEGELILSAGVPAAHAIRIAATGELPPPPPDQDAAGQTSAIPSSFGIEQNYPNPFNPTTRIAYSLPRQTATTLRVYDLLGREVATLVDGTQAAGHYSVEWDGTNSAGGTAESGVYFCRLEAGQFSAIRKLVLLR